MASVDTEEISFKELTELVVHNELNEITAFKVVLNSFLQKHPLTEKLPVHDALKSATELISLVSVLRKHLKWFNQQYGVHFSGLCNFRKNGKVVCRCLYFWEIAEFEERIRFRCRAMQPQPSRCLERSRVCF